MELGKLIQVRAKKNRVTGQDRRVVIPIHPTCGIDDVGSCVDYLLAKKHWKKKGKGKINAKELHVALKREALIHHIEKSNLESTVIKLVWNTWTAIEKACEVHRKPRYV